MAAPSDFASLQSSIQSALVQTTRTSSQLAAEDLSFHRSLSSNLGSNLDRQNARLLSIADRLLGSATADPAETSVRSSSTAPRLSDIEAVEGNWRAVVDVVDSLLERADTALDEFTGAVKRLSPGAEAKAGEKEASLKGLKGTGKISASLRGREIEKPQLSFDHVPQNDETGKFAPLLMEKPHAMVPFKGSVESGKHPYQAEIEQYTYPASMYTFAEPTMYHPFESTTAVMVDTEEAVDTMLEELKQAKEIAIDLEHHDHRSYIGIVSLMQISTRDKDWIVDTLKPWRRKLQCLNHVFADPSIIKILHGAFMDVMWLQRDLGLYLVGLFDTHYACRALGYPGGSYAYLLKRFCNVDAQKQYQLADWRIRPLPQELFDYARSDTHYLLYIFDHLRNELITKSNFSKPNHEGDKIYDVLTRSSETALQVYEHPVYDTELGQGPGGWYKLLARTPALLSKEQFAIFRAVHKWRDDVAREQDDSVHYVMPNHQIFSIAKAMPTTRAEVLGVAQPGTQTVRLRADELVSVIVRAKEEGKNGPEMVEVMSKVEPQFPRKPAQRQEQNHSVAAFLPQRQQPGTASGAPVVAANPRALRSDQSSFWGPAFSPPSQKPGAEQRRSMATANIDLSVPLPPLTAEVFADPAEAVATPVKSSEPATPAASTPADTPKAEDQDDDVFVLKQLGGGKKRKRQQPAFEQEKEKALDGLAQGNDEVALPSAEEEANRQQTKAERKRAKKEAKKAKKTADGAVGPNGTTDGLDNNDDDVPFDYNSAPSMLNPPRESKEDRKKREKKQVDPYKKAMDAPKGLVSSCIYKLLEARHRSLYLPPDFVAVSKLLLTSPEVVVHLQQQAWHPKSGDTVCDGPNSITFNSISANKTIHAVRANTVKTPGYDAFSASRSMSNTISALDKGTHAFKRRVQGQVLSEPALKAVEDRMLQQVQDFIDYIDGPEDRINGAHGHGDWVQRNGSDVCKYLTYNVLTDLCYGQSLNLFHSPTMRWLPKAVIPYSRIIVMDLAAPILYLKKWDRLLFNPYLKEIYRLGEWVKESHAARLALGKEANRNDFFSSLSKAVDPKTGEELSEKEFWLELLMLLVAGSDTTSVALNAAIYHLVHNRDSLHMAAMEVRRQFETEGEIRTGPKLSDCRFLLSCIEESMRLSPPVVHGPPRLVQAGGIVVDGEYFAEGTVVSTPTYTLHRSGKNFDAPDDFKPERWMTDGEELKRARQAYQPFHVGAYSCVGWRLAMMELQISLARLLFTYDLRLPPNAPCCKNAPRGERCQLEMKGWMTGHVKGPQVLFKRHTTHEDNEYTNGQSI